MASNLVVDLLVKKLIQGVGSVSFRDGLCDTVAFGNIKTVIVKFEDKCDDLYLVVSVQEGNVHGKFKPRNISER